MLRKTIEKQLKTPPISHLPKDQRQAVFPADRRRVARRFSLKVNELLCEKVTTLAPTQLSHLSHFNLQLRIILFKGL